MDKNEFKRIIEERTEREHEKTQFMFDLLISTVPTKREKVMILIGQQCSIISNRLKKIAAAYADLGDVNITKEEATEVFEYLQLVESGIVQFMKEKEESR